MARKKYQAGLAYRPSIVTFLDILGFQGRGMIGRTPYRAFLDRIPANDNSTEDTATETADTEAA